MSEPLSEREGAALWLAYAEEDLAAGRVLMGAADIQPRIAAFHFQQAAEKALKCVLSRVGSEIPYTQDLAKLALMVDAAGISARAPWHEFLPSMSGYAAVTRYPGERPPITPADLILAESVATALVDRAAALVRG